ncbi:phosphatase PAP2 family protein [Francisella frigiditurris]|uniref:undecaprenyl-diphosphate phosphatase n=1 Tax=Francisella frigiditurris TaxID=1542390 RepID=A0A1J0KRZ3_9GAMM|nr:phosphatase PAP2 family protein [Francisella frigiditurris]APC96560.1 PAP2 superfamily protein [Francisella frigiditurris]
MKNNFKENLLEAKDLLKSEKAYNFSMPKYLQLKYTFIPLAIVIILTFFYIDTPVEKMVIGLPSEVTYFFKKITDFGKAAWIIIVCAIIILTRLFISPSKLSEKALNQLNKLTSYASFIVVSVSISGIVGQIIKSIIGRARPPLFEQYGSAYFHHFNFFDAPFASMPSGHSTTIGSLFVCLFFIFPRFKYLWIVLAIFFAASRIFVRAHYPSDVIFGLALGSYTSIYLYYWLKNRKLI